MNEHYVAVLSNILVICTHALPQTRLGRFNPTRCLLMGCSHAVLTQKVYHSKVTPLNNPIPSVFRFLIFFLFFITFFQPTWREIGSKTTCRFIRLMQLPVHTYFSRQLLVRMGLFDTLSREVC